MKKNLTAGFTLFEAIMVLGILGIIVALALSRWPGDKLLVDAQAEQLAHDIQLAHTLAISRGKRFRINFASDHYSIYDRSNNVPYLHPGSSQANTPLKTGITLTSNKNFIVFDSLGRPYQDANLPGTALENKVVIKLTSPGGERARIIVNKETGKVTIS